MRSRRMLGILLVMCGWAIITIVNDLIGLSIEFFATMVGVLMIVTGVALRD